MDTPEALVLTVIALAFGTAIFVALAISGQRVLRGDGRVRLFEVLRGQGIPQPPRDNQAAVLESALAVRRCLACADHARCDQRIAARNWHGLADFCPNQSYVDRLRRKAHQFAAAQLFGSR